MTDFDIIRRSLTSRLFSTVTTVLTVAVAVALMLVLLSMRDSGRRAFERGSGNMHLMVSADGDPLTAVLNGVFYARPPRRAMDWTKYEEIASDPRITGDPSNARLDSGYAVPIQQGDSFRGFPVLATTEEFLTRFEPDAGRPWRFASGKGFDSDWQIVLGAEVARATGLTLGQRVVLTHGMPSGGTAHVHDEYSYEVVGIMERTGSAHDRAAFTNLQSSWILHAHDRIAEELRKAGGTGGHAHDHNDPNHVHDEHCNHGVMTTAADLLPADRKITGIYLRVTTPKGSAVAATLPQIFDGLRRDPTITVAQPVQEINKLFGIVSNVDRILLAMAAVVLISSGIAVMLALYNSMEQRRRQIAVLRVLGCSRPRVFGLVLTESAVIGALGAAAGFGLCLLGVRIVAAAMKERVGLVIEPAFGLDWVLPVLTGTIALAALAGIIPAMMAYRTAVAKNLRPLA